MEESKKNSIIKAIVMMILAAMVVLGLFMLFTRNGSKSNTQEEDRELTEVQKITTLDLSKNYPQTPAAVADLYLKTMQVMYKQTYTDEEFDSMAQVLKGIFDTELIAQQNDWPNGLKTEVQDKKDGDYSIPVYEVDKNDARQTTEDGEEISNVLADVSLRHGTSSTKYTYLFILRKNSEDKWKLMGWTSQEKAE